METKFLANLEQDDHVRKQLNNQCWTPPMPVKMQNSSIPEITESFYIISYYSALLRC